jgi:hypothetical protein
MRRARGLDSNFNLGGNASTLDMAKAVADYAG